MWGTGELNGDEWHVTVENLAKDEGRRGKEKNVKGWEREMFALMFWTPVSLVDRRLRTLNHWTWRTPCQISSAKWLTWRTLLSHFVNATAIAGRLRQQSKPTSFALAAPLFLSALNTTQHNTTQHNNPRSHAHPFNCNYHLITLTRRTKTQSYAPQFRIQSQYTWTQSQVCTQKIGTSQARSCSSATQKLYGFVHRRAQRYSFVDQCTHKKEVTEWIQVDGGLHLPHLQPILGLLQGRSKSCCVFRDLARAIRIRGLASHPTAHVYKQTLFGRGHDHRLLSSIRSQ
jgi:hypothetical protein